MGKGRRSAGRERAPRGSGSDTSASGRDWAWTRDRLRRGEAPERLEALLAARRSDKPRPGYYARRTVRRALESLGGRQRGAREAAGPSR